MIRTVTGERLRFLVSGDGGAPLPDPLRVLGEARTRTEADERAHAEVLWRRSHPDPDMEAAAALLRSATVRIGLSATVRGGRPVRALLAVADEAVLVRQEAVRRRDGTWSSDTGGACRVSTGALTCLAADLAGEAPMLDAARGAPVRAAARDVAGPAAGNSVRALTTGAERIRRILAVPRRGAGQAVVESVPESHAGGPVSPSARLVWLDTDCGGYLFDGPGMAVDVGAPGTAEDAVFLRPAGGTALREAVVRMATAATLGAPR